jgi:transposase
MSRFVGLDLHRREAQVAILDARGHQVASFRVATTRQSLEEFARQHLTPEDQLVLEATAGAWPVARLLQPFVARVLVSNPRQTQAIAQAKIKTDKIDARVLADLLRAQYLPLVWMPDPETQQRRALCHRRASLVAQRTRLKNRVRSHLARELIAPYDGDLFGARGMTWLRSLPLPAATRSFVESDLRLLAGVEAELTALEETLVPLAFDDPNVRLLMTLPGLDYTIALTLLAALGEIDRFPDGDHVAGFLGLAPSTRQSGDKCYHGPITRRGNRRARWLLIQAAQHLAAHPGPLGVFFRRLLRKKNRNVAVVATARKLAVIAWHMLKHNEPYRYAQPKTTEQKLQRLRVKATGVRRKTGPRKGAPPAPNQGKGLRTRTCPSLPDIYQREGLPSATAPDALTAGEQRVLAAMGTAPYVAEIQHPTCRPRSKPETGA